MAPPATVRLVVAGQLDAVAERALGRPLQVDVEREADGVAGLRIAARLERALLPAERVDADLCRARLAAEVRVECRLDPGLADLVPAA